LIQFPWSFINSEENRKYLEKLFGFFSEFPLALEVRHSSWDRPEFYNFLKEKELLSAILISLFSIILLSLQLL
jgi:uncharacterized protein YecE (DUF72 family)